MKPSSLDNLTITDFRSIRGTVSIPLNAPVVLIHGSNGAGKTSVLSALEMALIGDLEALKRTDAKYIAHVPHHGAQQASVALTTLLGLDKNKTEIVVNGNKVHGVPLLDLAQRQFFSERSYLAQSTLGKLLELYQHSAPRGESALTRFIKDILGLDQLDALIDGLQPSQDIRNARKLVSEYSFIDAKKEALRSELSHNEQLIQQISNEKQTADEQLMDMLQQINLDLFLDLGDLNEVLIHLELESEESKLIELGALKRTLFNFKLEAEKLKLDSESIKLEDAEVEESNARALVDKWWANIGSRLETEITSLRTYFPDLPAVSDTAPVLAFESAFEKVEAEIERCTSLLKQDDNYSLAINDAEVLLAGCVSDIAITDERIQLTGNSAGDLAKLLAEIVPHIDGDDCPVCRRDYSELSSGTLGNKISAEIMRLSSIGATLQELQKVRSALAVQSEKLQQSIAAARSHKMDQQRRVELKTREAALVSSKTELARLKDSVPDGDSSIRKHNMARAKVSGFRSNNATASNLRNSVFHLSSSMLKIQNPDAPVLEIIKHLEVAVAEKEEVLLSKEKVRRSAIEKTKLTIKIIGDFERTGQRRTALKAELASLNTVLENGERVRNSIKKLLKSAIDVRSSIILRVFNESLNKVWKNLFIRLAPSEPYVPAFKIPEAGGRPVVAQLETVHISGESGGSPGAMLSAGNLNTAALTLFLALHLSVDPKLPWLILDDPVQAMDEVHIAQFAALLRTLAKEHNRQIVIAVHDKALFDYLALELSPAFEKDSLITIELSRTTNGDTNAEPTFHHWKIDQAIAA